MDIGIIGSGSMGVALGRLWAGTGHGVMFSFSRDEGRLREAAAEAGPSARSGSPKEAAAFGEVVVLTVPWAAREAALEAAGPLPEGKVLISSVMPLSKDMGSLEIGHATSAAEEIAKLAPGARVVETFNSVFAPLLQEESREFDGSKPSVFYCGDDDGAKGTAAGLLRDAGLDPVDAGPLRNARYLEPFGMLMVQLAYEQGRGVDIAVRLLERSGSATT